MATKRGYYREELLRAMNNLAMCIVHLSRVIEAYNEIHPEVSSPITEATNAILAIAEVIEKVYDEI